MWHIWDFPDSVYVRFNDKFRENLFGTLRKHSGSRAKLAKALGYDTTTIKGFLQCGHDSGGHPMYTPVKLIKNIPKVLNVPISVKLTYEIEQSITAYRCRAGWSVNQPVLPIKETPEFYSTAAHLMCDGSAAEGKTPYYANTCRELREELVRDLQIFGDVEVNEYKMHSNVYGVMFPKAISDIISHLLGVPFVNQRTVPQKIFSASAECQRRFLRAAFDDEGSVPLSTKSINFSTKDIGVAKGIIKLLALQNIEAKYYQISRGNEFPVRVTSECREIFLEKIGFSHPDKMERLQRFVQERIEQKSKRPKFKNRILQIVEEKMPIDRFRIMQISGGTPAQVTLALYELRKEGKTKSYFSGKNKPYLWTRVCDE